MSTQCQALEVQTPQALTVRRQREMHKQRTSLKDQGAVEGSRSQESTGMQAWGGICRGLLCQGLLAAPGF